MRTEKPHRPHRFANWDNGRLARCKLGQRASCPLRTGTTGGSPVGMIEPHHSLIFGRGGRGGDEGLARTRGGYLRKTWRNRGKNEVRPGAWPHRFLRSLGEGGCIAASLLVFTSPTVFPLLPRIIPNPPRNLPRNLSLHFLLCQAYTVKHIRKCQTLLPQ